MSRGLSSIEQYCQVKVPPKETCDVGAAVSAFRIAIALEEIRWIRTGGKANTKERRLGDDAMLAAKLYARAASMAVDKTAFEAFFMSLLFDTYRGLVVEGEEKKR